MDKKDEDGMIDDIVNDILQKSKENLNGQTGLEIHTEKVNENTAYTTMTFSNPEFNKSDEKYNKRPILTWKINLRRWWKGVKDEWSCGKWYFLTKHFPFYQIMEVVWWIRHRTTNKYHIVKLDVAPGYSDIDERMLQACFALLCEFVENEVRGFQKNEELNPEYIEISRLYKWWKFERPLRKEPDVEFSDIKHIPIEFDKDGDPILWKIESEDEDKSAIAGKIYGDWEKACLKEDEDNLISLVKLKGWMWT